MSRLKLKLLIYPYILCLLRLAVTMAYKKLPIFQYFTLLNCLNTLFYICAGCLLGDLIVIDEKELFSNKYFLIAMALPIIIFLVLFGNKIVFDDISFYMTSSLVMLGFYFTIIVKGLWNRSKNK